MSRSFVRAWATVATIMALVCFAFVQPMPEHTATPRVHQQADKAADRVVVSGDQLMTSPPFVDSVLTGKTFTPYLVLARPALMPGSIPGERSDAGAGAAPIDLRRATDTPWLSLLTDP